MRIKKRIITLKVHPDKVYVPPLTRTHHLDDVSLMAGTIGGLGGGTGQGQGDGGFTPPGGRGSAKQGMFWDDESPVPEE